MLKNSGVTKFSWPLALFWSLSTLIIVFSPFSALLVPPMFIDLSMSSLWFPLIELKSRLASLCVSKTACPAFKLGTGVELLELHRLFLRLTLSCWYSVLSVTVSVEFEELCVVDQRDSWSAYFLDLSFVAKVQLV